MTKRDCTGRHVARVLAGAVITMAMLSWPGDAMAFGFRKNPVGRSGCGQAASDLLKASQSEAWGDYWVELAKARNLGSPEETKAAIRGAADGLREALDEGEDQFDARVELCTALGERIYNPEIDPADFESGLSNPYFPLAPGTTRLYKGETSEGTETIVIKVTEQTREILGVTCVVVRDSVYFDGELAEDTFDYYAADNLGNIWYFGENTVEIEDGFPVSTAGAWIAGEDGAKPGIVMLATPVPGVTYRQEFSAANAEDAAKVLSLSETVSVPFGTFTTCLKTADFTPISPDALEHKFYAPGVGFVKETNPETGDELVLLDVTTN